MDHDCSTSHGTTSPLTLLLLLSGCVMAQTVSSPVWADTWVCPRPGQADLYTDREYPGCRQLGESRTYSPLTISPASRSPKAAISAPPVSATVIPGVSPSSQSRKPSSFSETTLSVPVVAVSQPKSGFIAGSWIGLIAQLTVRYKADGRGPEILHDSNLMPVAAHSFLTAVEVASREVGYDPRYLSLRILVPTRLDGPSAGGIFTVGIAAALLGDSIRDEVCMSGTIEQDAEIQAVGRLVDKMNACRDLRKTTMIVPDALDNSHLNFTGAERSIHVTEVHTLAEAYNAVTGQALRQVP